MLLKKIILSSILGAAVFSSGCSTFYGESRMSNGLPSKAVVPVTKNDALTKALARVELAQTDARNARAEAEAARAALESASQNTGGELFPPSAQAGHCYARVFIPANFIDQSEQVLVREASSRLEVIQPEYEWVNERKLLREASTRIEVVPAEYKTISEQVMVKPAMTRLETVAAEFSIIEEQVIDKPARSEWKRGSHFINAALQTRTDAGTGEVMCLVEVPATYKTVSRTVQTTPPSTREVTTPAVYETVSKTVLVSAPSTREIPIPAQYTSVRQLKLVKAGETKEITIPAEYETVTRSVKTGEEMLEWREVLCDVNMTQTLVSELQRQLHQEGYFDSPVDGIYQQLTQNGVNRYAENAGLPFGSNYIALEVANALGLNY